MSNVSYYSHYPLESLLRPPVEWYSASFAGITACLSALFPSIFMLTPNLGYRIALCFSLLSLCRFLQGLEIIRYQRNLKRLSYYSMASDEIPMSHSRLFLGRGFRWTAQHTQRLYDCKKAENLRYLELPFFYRLARALEFRWNNTFFLKYAARFVSSQNRCNPYKPLPPVGGNPAIHGVELKEEDIWMNLSERAGHTIVLGTTRVGKTRFLEVQAVQDIRRGDTVIIFDPKGDRDLLRRIYLEAKAAKRGQDVLVFHLGYPEYSARYNPIGQFARITEVANRIANQLPSSGESAAFKEFAWRFVNIIAKTLVALGRKPYYQQIQRYILNVDPLIEEYCSRWLAKERPNWSGEVQNLTGSIKIHELVPHLRSRSLRIIAIYQYIQKYHLYDAIAEGLFSAFHYDKTYFDKITASLLPLIEKLTTGQIAALISPNYFDLNDPRPIFDWKQVIHSKKIVYVGLDALSDATVASAVGSSMFSDLCSIAGQLYKFGLDGQEVQGNRKNQNKLPPVISVYADEFNEIANDDVTTVLNKGGGAGFQLTLFTQTWSDVEVRLGTNAKASQVGGNLNTIICMRVLDEVTAQYLTAKLPQKVIVKDLVEVSSVTDTLHHDGTSGFTSSNEDRIFTSEVPMIAPDDLLQLPKGQAFCLIEGGRLYKIRMPLPRVDSSDFLDSREIIKAAMNAHISSEEVTKETKGTNVIKDQIETHLNNRGVYE